MKRILVSLTAAALALTSAVSLAGCGSNESSSAKVASSSSSAASSKVEESTSSAASITADDVKFTYNGATVELNSEASSAIEALGDYLDVSSELSCHGKGEDMTYTYDGFTVTSYPDSNGVNRVLEIVINTEGKPTNKGIRVGSSVSDVVAAYGNGYKEIGVYYAYDAGGKKSLQFYIENDTVKEIDYYYNV